MFTNCRISDTGCYINKTLVVTPFVCYIFVSLAGYLPSAKHSKNQTATLTVNIPLGQTAEDFD